MRPDLQIRARARAHTHIHTHTHTPVVAQQEAPLPKRLPRAEQHPDLLTASRDRTTGTATRTARLGYDDSDTRHLTRNGQGRASALSRYKRSATGQVIYPFEQTIYTYKKRERFDQRRAAMSGHDQPTRIDNSDTEAGTRFERPRADPLVTPVTAPFTLVTEPGTSVKAPIRWLKRKRANS